jgi:hypothetical protein
MLQIGELIVNLDSIALQRLAILRALSIDDLGKIAEIHLHHI